MFSGENLKSWNRTTLRVGVDSMQNLSFPTKILAAGRVALDEAEAAGHRFAAAKFALQRRVLGAYLDYALQAEQIRLRAADVELGHVAVAAAESGLYAGASQQRLLGAEASYRLATNDLRTMQADLVAMRALLNSVLGRDPDAPLTPPASLPEPRPLPDDDGYLLAVASDGNPELKALADEVQGRGHALALARQQYLPDINPFAGITGSMEQFAGVMVMLATTIPQIRASIAESRDMLQRGEAVLSQTRHDRAAEVVAALTVLRNSERQVRFLETEVLPILEEKVSVATDAYANSTSELIDLIESQRAIIELRRALAEARIMREKKLADVEALMGVDVEVLS
jgi:outer membrane protein TolC